MALTYVTKINKVRVQKNQNGLINVITRVFYTVIATAEDGYQKYLLLELQFSSPDQQDFIPIESIDEPTLVSWVEAHPYYMPISEQQIEDMIQFERDRPFIENYPFDFLYEVPASAFN